MVLAGGCAGPAELETGAVARSIPGATGGGGPRAQDAYVLLSGGGTPISNHYSQYLQARAIAGFLQREFPPEATWIFFGAGNRDDVAPKLADVRREVKRDGLIVQTWLPGLLPNNRPATRASFLRALREEILPRVSGGGTLHLFVGDHGELIGPENREESAITLWQLKPARRRATGWTSDDKEVLGVAELRQVIEAGLGRGRVVFCMTQCHSGGFHELGVTRDVAPPRTWFSSAPSPAIKNAPRLRRAVAGYTATDQASPAAGCDADPDPDRWRGYERFMPERLLGRDLMDDRVTGAGVGSLAAAHEAATLIDHTIDKPRATSEHYLESWARLIEQQLAKTLLVTERTRRAVEAYQVAVDRGRIEPASAALRERQEQFARFTAALVAQLPEARELLLTGTRAQLEAAIRGRGQRGGPPGGRRGAMAELRKLWSETLRPAWKTAMAGGPVEGLPAGARAFELRLLELEEKGRDFLLPRGNDDTPLLVELYAEAGYATPATLDPVKAGVIARWGAERRNRIVAWGRAAADPRVRAAAAKIGPGPVFTEEPPTPLSRRVAAERVLFYRRVLAAWSFLLAMDASAPLADLQTLLDLERMPVRRGPGLTSGPVLAPPDRVGSVGG